MSKTFGEVVKEARERKGLTPKDMAEQLGFKNVGNYYPYEKDQIKALPVEYVRKLCELLEIDANQLFGVEPLGEGPKKVSGKEDKELAFIEQVQEFFKKTEMVNPALLTEAGIKGKPEDFLATVLKETVENVVDAIKKEVDTHGFDEELIHLYVQYEQLWKENP